MWLVLLCALENDDGDMEMSSDEEKEDIEMLRKKLMEWGSNPFSYQSFNWRNPRSYGLVPEMDKLMLDSFNRSCNRMKSFDFSIDQPAIVGKVKRCTYSELDGIANFKNPQVLQKTTSGRLFRGIIIKGPKERSVIVKTWDFLLPSRSDPDQCLNEFCDEIELFTDERVNMHPNLVKLYGYCCDTRLTLVFDEKFTGQVLWDVLLSDDFGWDEWMKVVTQLADPFSCLHENKIAFGCVTSRYIMIDKESNIKVFDYGYVIDVYKVDPSILHQPMAPEILKGMFVLDLNINIFLSYVFWYVKRFETYREKNHIFLHNLKKWRKGGWQEKEKEKRWISVIEGHRKRVLPSFVRKEKDFGKVCLGGFLLGERKTT